MPNHEDGAVAEASATSHGSALLNPIVIVALLIIGSVIAFIGLAIFGWDHGVLRSMSQSTFARGLITYLFAVVTIGTAVILVLSGLLGASDAATEKRFERGKEILSLLLGVFGTIVGFYFGSEAASGGPKEAATLQVSTLDVAPTPDAAPGTYTVRAVVSGGESPYEYGISVNSREVEAGTPVRDDGWISESLAVPSERSSTIRLLVVDSADHKATARYSVHPGATNEGEKQ
jgi:hypothetical protein